MNRPVVTDVFVSSPEDATNPHIAQAFGLSAAARARAAERIRSGEHIPCQTWSAAKPQPRWLTSESESIVDAAIEEQRAEDDA